MVQFSIYFRDIIDIREDTEDNISQLIVDGLSRSVFRIDSSSLDITAQSKYINRIVRNRGLK